MLHLPLNEKSNTVAKRAELHWRFPGESWWYNQGQTGVVRVAQTSPPSYAEYMS